MSQINVNQDSDDSAGPRTAATNNLTWAIAMILIIAAVVVAIMYVSGHMHL